jgi:hypothetical protein
VAVLLRRIGAAVSGGADTATAHQVTGCSLAEHPARPPAAFPSWCVVCCAAGAWTHNAVAAWLAEQVIVRGISAVQPRSGRIRVTARAQPDQGRHVSDQLGHPGGVLASAQPQLPIWQPDQGRRNRLTSAALDQQHQRVLHSVAFVGPWFTQRLAHVPAVDPLAQRHPVQLASCGGQGGRGGSVALLQLGQDPG